MGSSSCCRPHTAYEKVPSLDSPSCLSCGRSPSDANLRLLLQVSQRSRHCGDLCCKPNSAGLNTSSSTLSSSERPNQNFGVSLYNPLKLEQRQRHIEGAFRDFQVQSRSTRRNIELDLPTHVTIRPGEGPPISHGPWSERRRPQAHLDSCVRAPPNQSPFSPPIISSRTTSTVQGTCMALTGKNGSNNNTINNNQHTREISQISQGITGRSGRKTL